MDLTPFKMAAPSLGSKFGVAGAALELKFERGSINKKVSLDSSPSLHQGGLNTRREIFPGNVRDDEPATATGQLADVFWHIEFADPIGVRDSLQPLL